LKASSIHHDELVQAEERELPANTLLDRETWGLDRGGNWLSRSRTATNFMETRTISTLNQLTQVGEAGETVIEGTVNEFATVQVTLADGAGATLIEREPAELRANPATGLELALYRAYDPALGRWMSRDPIEEMGPDGPNLYAYVVNNPTYLLDQTGLCSGPESGTGSWHGPLAPFIGWGIGLAQGAAYAASEKIYGGGTTNDKYWHCVTSCQIARYAGKSVAIDIGNWQERKEPYSADAIEDQKANKCGRNLSGREGSCHTLCSNAGYGM
jgi:RHS repeat-associated protein